jgi:hypothetical protein
MNEQKSNISSRLRKTVAPIVFECSAVDLSSSTEREKFKAKIGWVDDGDNQGHYDTWNVEILYKENEKEYDKSAIFLNDALMQVCARFLSRGRTWH